MTDKQTRPLEVRPNTLRDQRAPNTWRNQAGPGADGARDLNAGGGNAGPGRRLGRPQVPLWAYAIMAVLALDIVLYVLNGTP